MRALIDTNVLLDAIFAREPFLNDSKKLFELIREKRIEGCVSVQSLKDIFYICNKASRFKDPTETIEKLSFILDVIDVNSQDSFSTLMSDIKDYENGLLVFSAKRNNIRIIITRNEKDFIESDLMIINPKDIDQYLDTFTEVKSTVIDNIF